MENYCNGCGKLKDKTKSKCEYCGYNYSDIIEQQDENASIEVLYATVIEQQDVIIDDKNYSFCTQILNFPIIPYSCNIEINNIIIAVDNGGGEFTGNSYFTGSIDYKTGLINFKFKNGFIAYSDNFKIIYSYSTRGCE